MHSLFRIVVPGILLLELAACSGGGGAVGGAGGVRAGAPPRFSTAAGASLPSAWEDAARTSHVITLAGEVIPYTATAGHVTATTPDGKVPEASFFYVAYTAEGQDPARRPVTFYYNGGPGSSTVWLHLGSFGPRRLATGDPATTAQAPFPLVDNADCLLDTTDLVFVDAVGTGLSEAIAPNANRVFWGVDADAKVFRDFVRCWLAANGRQASPFYLFGESYGTPRTAVLANLLSEAGLAPAGIILQSSILDYNANGDAASSASVAGFLPSYSAVGSWFHMEFPLPADPVAFLQGMCDFTAAAYVPAVEAWNSKSKTPPSPALAAKLQGDTGISASLWEQQLNLLPNEFQKDLIPQTLLGRYDARVFAPADSPLASDGDPSSAFISPSFKAAILGYLQDVLKYPDAAGYRISGDAIDYWDFSHDGNALPDTIPDLAAALRRSPDMRVLSLNGYHDLATPFYQTDLDLARLGAHPRLGIKHYRGGHMVYLDDVSRPLEKADMVAFYQASPGWTATTWAAPGTARFRPTFAPAPAPALAPPQAPSAVPTGPLYDPYVPPAQRHPSLRPPTTGADLDAQVEWKLAHPSK